MAFHEDPAAAASIAALARLSLEIWLASKNQDDCALAMTELRQGWVIMASSPIRRWQDVTGPLSAAAVPRGAAGATMLTPP